MTEENKKIVDDESATTLDTPEVKKTKEEKNTKIVDDESAKPSDTSTNKENNEPVSKERFDAVNNNLSEKDRELSNIQKELHQMKNREAVKDLLLDSELPDVVKQQLKSNIDTISPETFEGKSSELMKVYESGRKSYETAQVKSVTKTPDKTKDVEWSDKVAGAESVDDLESEWNKI